MSSSERLKEPCSTDHLISKGNRISDTYMKIHQKRLSKLSLYQKDTNIKNKKACKVTASKKLCMNHKYYKSLQSNDMCINNTHDIVRG